jgi:hypothetical protein
MQLASFVCSCKTVTTLYLVNILSRTELSSIELITLSGQASAVAGVAQCQRDGGGHMGRRAMFGDGERYGEDSSW